MKWKSDSKFRRDFLHTVAILLGFMASGFLAGQTGPTFLDLSEIAQEDLSTASWLHPSCSLACVFSSLLFGFLSERHSRDLLMATSLTGAGVFALIRPWCTVLLAMIAAHALACFCICGMETVGNAFIMSLWGTDGAPYMQMVHFAFAVGGIIAPVVTEPFLSSQHHVYNTSTTMAPYVTTGNQEDEFELYNHSYINVNVSSSHDMLEGTGTRIHFAYLIGTILDILCAMPFLGVYIMQTKTMKHEDKKNKTLRGIRRHEGTLKFRQKIVMMVFLAIICHLYLAVEKTFFTYLMTFCILHFHWNKSASSLASSLSWIGFSSGRFIGIFLANALEATRMIFLFCTFLIISSVAFLCSSTFYIEPLTWVSVVLVGLSLSVIYPSIFSWIEETLFPVSGQISSLVMISSSSGAVLTPIYLGYLMEKFTPMWFTYVLTGQSVLFCILFLTTLVVSKLCFRKCRKKAVIEIEIEIERL